MAFGQQWCIGSWVEVFDSLSVGLRHVGCVRAAKKVTALYICNLAYSTVNFLINRYLGLSTDIKLLHNSYIIAHVMWTFCFIFSFDDE